VTSGLSSSLKRVAEPDDESLTLECRRSALTQQPKDLSAQAEVLARTGAGARIDFDAADEATKREVVAGVLCNLSAEDGDMVSYQPKRPFEYLRGDSKGAFYFQWWPKRDALQTMRLRSAYGIHVALAVDGRRV